MSRRPVAARVLGLGRRLVRQLRVPRPAIAPRAELEYATHVPVLVALARLLPLRRVLELGAGRYSTLTMLDRSAFPDLRELRSVEDDARWAAAVVEMAGPRRELDVAAVSPPVSAWVSAADLSGYDLVLVDDSRSAAERSATIREVMARADRGSVVVIHDFEVDAYRAAARVGHQYRLTALNPNTGVCWWRAPLRRRALARVDALIRAHAAHVATDGVAAWTAVFDKAGVGSRGT